MHFFAAVCLHSYVHQPIAGPRAAKLLWGLAKHDLPIAPWWNLKRRLRLWKKWDYFDLGSCFPWTMIIAWRETTFICNRNDIFSNGIMYVPAYRLIMKFIHLYIYISCHSVKQECQPRNKKWPPWISMASKDSISSHLPNPRHFPLLQSSKIPDDIHFKRNLHPTLPPKSCKET